MMATEQLKLAATIDILDRLRGGGERRGRVEDIHQMIDLLTEGHIFLGSDLQDGISFYRGRLLRNKRPFTALKNLTLRSAADVTDFGRCNGPGQTVLYASSNLETVFSELSVQIGELVQIIKIRKKDGVPIKCTVVGDIDHVRRHGKSSLGGEGFTKAIEQYWDSLSELGRLRLNLTDAFVADKFRSPARYSFEYKVTSIFSAIVFAQGFDAFYYPSVGHLGGWNIAISENVFRHGFEVTESEVREVFDAPGYGIFGSQRLFESKKIDGDSIELCEVSALHAFPSFDYFMWFNHCRLPHEKTILFQVLKIVPQGQVELVLKNQPPIGVLENNDQQVFTQLTINGSFPVELNKDFEALSKFISENCDSWDFVVCDVAQTKKTDEVARQLTDFVVDVGKGNHSYSIFDRKGKTMTPIFGSAAYPV